MANGRMLRFSFFRNEELAEVSMAGRLLFQGLWLLADREGRLEDRVKRIKADIFPYDDVDVEAELHSLVQHGFIQRYSVDGKRYIWVITFLKHQSINLHEAASVCPPPPGSTDVHMHAHASTEMHVLIKENIREENINKENMHEHANGVAPVVTPRASKATVKPSRTLKEKKTKPNLPENIPRPRNPLWDALEEAFNFHPVMTSERSHLGKIVRELQEAGATPEEIPLRIARYCKRYGRDYLTLDALHKHWSEFATEPIMTNGGQLDAKDREVLAANREDTKRRLYEEAMRLANDEASLDGQFPGTKVAGG